VHLEFSQPRNTAPLPILQKRRDFDEIASNRSKTSTTLARPKKGQKTARFERKQRAGDKSLCPLFLVRINSFRNSRSPTNREKHTNLAGIAMRTVQLLADRRRTT
jgi:hypothetical protein